MSARFAVGVAALLIGGCAVVQEKTPLAETPTAPTPTCKSATDCEAKWAAARNFVLSHTTYKLQNDSVDRLDTFNSVSDVSMTLRASVTKLIQPDGSYAITAKFWCNNLFECSPNANKTLDDFNREIGSMGRASAPPAAPASPTPVAVAVAVTPSPSPAATATVESASLFDVEKYIRESESAWAESVASGDNTIAKRILAEDCVLVLDGRVLDKAQMIAGAANGPGDFVSNHLDHAQVRVYGDTAIAQGSETWTRKSGKKGRFVWTDTWIRRNGQWQIVAAQDTTAPIDK